MRHVNSCAALGLRWLGGLGRRPGGEERRVNHGPRGVEKGVTPASNSAQQAQERRQIGARTDIALHMTVATVRLVLHGGEGYGAQLDAEKYAIMGGGVGTGPGNPLRSDCRARRRAAR